ncbi:MAG: hypothetical protein RLZZ450_93 [Pseudomonadota bacterium]
MSIYFIDPPGPLTNTSEPIDFTTDSLVTSISIEFNPHLGNGLRETVWDGTADGTDVGGDFSFAYAKSTHSDLDVAGPYTWQIKRNTKWPAEFRIRVKESTQQGGSPPAPGLYPALTPTVLSPVAQYALQGGADLARVYLDRSGNGYHLTKGTPSATPDLISGQTAVVGVSGAGIGNATRLQRPAFTAALQITGPLTISARVKRTTGNSGVIACMSGIFGAGNTRNTLFTCSILSSGAMEVFWESTAGVSNQRDSAAGLVPLDTWCWVTWRRDTTDGRWTFGANLAYENTTPGLGTSGGSEAFLSIACQDEAPDIFWAGGLADVSIWASRLSDAQLLPLYKNAMGIA